MPENFAVDNFAGVRLIICAADRKVDFGARIAQGLEYCVMDKHRREQSAKRTGRAVDLSHGPQQAFLDINSASKLSEYLDAYVGKALD